MEKIDKRHGSLVVKEISDPLQGVSGLRRLDDFKACFQAFFRGLSGCLRGFLEHLRVFKLLSGFRGGF